MTASDSQYFQRRAHEERLAAKRALDERARRSHAVLADCLAEVARSGFAPVEEDRAAAGLPLEFKIIPPQRG